MTSLPPYSGERPTCVMCRHVGASTSFRRPGRCDHDGGSHSLSDNAAPARLHRECAHCGYAWDEATLEAAPPLCRPLDLNGDCPDCLDRPRSCMCDIDNDCPCPPGPGRVGAPAPDKDTL